MVHTIRIDREKLFEEIWTEPILKVSERYNISDVGLLKPAEGCICRSSQSLLGAYRSRAKDYEAGAASRACRSPATVELSPTGPTVASETAAEARRAAREGTNNISAEEHFSYPLRGWARSGPYVNCLACRAKSFLFTKIRFPVPAL
jgi:hypothetical protein